MFYQKKQNNVRITTFEQCAAKYPVMESYPPQCNTPDGKHFTQNRDIKPEFTGEIQIVSPRPDEKIDSPISITGQARGSWFFEGSFPVQLRDENGNTITTGVVTATDDWMTDELVPFSGKLSFTKPGTEKGILFFRNDNPSGQDENEKSLKIPIQF